METWALMNFKGGVLKTSSAVCLAGVLSKLERRVLLIDFDVQSNVSLTFAKNPDRFEKRLLTSY